VVIPDHLIGRVVSAFRMLGYGAVPLGALLGGVVGRILGVRAPFLLGAAVLGATGLLALPVVNDRSVRTAITAAEATRRSATPDRSSPCGTTTDRNQVGDDRPAAMVGDGCRSFGVRRESCRHGVGQGGRR